MAEEIHVNDIGTVFQITLYDGDAVVDISSATVKSILFAKPSGTAVTKTAEFTTDGTDGKLQYTTVEDDLDTAGTWKIQGRVTLTDGTWSSSTSRFRVYSNLG